MKATLVITKGQDGFLIGKIKEIPAVITQGATVEEVKDNILDALALYLEDMRDDDTDDGEVVVQEQLLIA